MTTQARSAETRGQLPQLTGLRGLAAAVVFISHAAILGFLPPGLGHGFGQVGVMIFFVLSGFLMAYLYLPREPSKSNVIAYARARIGRVVPLYLALLLISVVVSNFVDEGFRYSLPLNDPAQVFRAVLFVEAPWELWTIPVEIQFYLAFVVVWLLYPRLKVWSLAIVGISVSIPAALYFVLLDAKPSILPTYGFAFFIGALTAHFLPRLHTALAGRVPSSLGLIFLVLLFANLPAVRDQLGLSISGGGYVSTWLDPVTWLIVFGLFLSCLLASPSLRFLDSRPFIFLGNISYGLYLLHYPILEGVSRIMGVSPFGFIIATVASVSLAWLSYTFFEIPMMKLVRGKRPSPSPVP